MEGELEQQGQGSGQTPANQSLEVSEKEAATRESYSGAEQALAEAAEAIQEAIQSRARLLAPAPLSHAEIRLAAARDQFEAGDYVEARMIAQQALSSAVQALSHAKYMRQIRKEQQRRQRRIWGYSILGLMAGLILWRGIGYMVQSPANLPLPDSQAGLSLPPSWSPEATSSVVSESLKSVPAGPSPPAVEAPVKRFVVVDVARLNVREGPGIHFRRYSQQLTHGEKVRVTQQQGNWLQVELGSGKKGWIAGQYTRKAASP